MKINRNSLTFCEKEAYPSGIALDRLFESVVIFMLVH